MVRNATEEECKALSEIADRCLREPWSEGDLIKAVKDPCGVVLTALLTEGASEDMTESARADMTESARAELTEGARAEAAGFAVSYLAGGEGELLNIAVLPEFRKRGIGRALLQRLLEEAEDRGCEAMFLEVRVSNGAAVALYEGRGFQRVGTRKHFYEAPREDALVLKYTCDRKVRGT